MLQINQPCCQLLTLNEFMLSSEPLGNTEESPLAREISPFPDSLAVPEDEIPSDRDNSPIAR